MVDWGAVTVIFERYSRNFFYKVGKINAMYPYRVILVCILFSIFCCIGLRKKEDLTETRSEYLWVPQDSTAFQDQDVLTTNFGQEDKLIRYLAEPKGGFKALQANSLREAFRLEFETAFYAYSKNGDTYYSYDGISPDICESVPGGCVRLCRSLYYNASNPNTGSPCTIRSVFGSVWNYNREVMEALTDEQALIDINAYDQRQRSTTLGVPVDAFMGEIVRDESGLIVDCGALLTTWYLDGNYDIDPAKVPYAPENGEFAQRYIPIEASEDFQDDYLDLVENFGSIHFTYHRFATVTNEREVSAAASAGTELVLISIGLVFAFLAFSFAKPDLIRSQILLGLLGMVVVLLAIVTGIGLGLWCDVKFTPITQVIVFLVLGMGVANYIILAESYEEADPELSVTERNANALSHAGAFVFLTNGTTIIAFIVGSNSNFPAVEAFGLDAAIVCFINFVYNLTMWDAMLVLSAHRVVEGRMDCFCVKMARPFQPPDEAQNALEEQHELIGLAIKKYIVPYVPTKKYRYGTLIFFLVMFCIGIWGVTSLQEGLDLKDVVADDSYYTEFYRLTSIYFAKYGPALNVILRQPNPASNLPDDARGILYSSPADRESMTILKQELQALQYIDENAPVTFVFDIYDSFRLQSGGRFPMPADNETIYLEDMENFFFVYRDPTTGSYPFFSLKYDVRFEYGPDGKPVSCLASRMKTFHVSTMTKSAELIDALDETRDAVETTQLNDSPTYARITAYANDYLIWDSFSSVRSECFRNLVVSIICVFMVLLCLLHPLASLLVALVIFIMDVQILAWIPLWNLELNSVTTICIIMSVGMAVDYSAHIAHSFQVNEGTKPERAAKSVSDMGRAIVSGAFATFLGILMLAFAPTAINRTFFTMMAGVAIVGMVHGLFLLPVIMSFIGPDFSDPNQNRVVGSTPSINNSGGKPNKSINDSLLGNQW